MEGINTDSVTKRARKLCADYQDKIYARRLWYEYSGKIIEKTEELLTNELINSTPFKKLSDKELEEYVEALDFPREKNAVWGHYASEGFILYENGFKESIYITDRHHTAKEIFSVGVAKSLIGFESLKEKKCGLKRKQKELREYKRTLDNLARKYNVFSHYSMEYSLRRLEEDLKNIPPNPRHAPYKDPLYHLIASLYILLKYFTKVKEQGRMWMWIHVFLILRGFDPIPCKKIKEKGNLLKLLNGECCVGHCCEEFIYRRCEVLYNRAKRRWPKTKSLLKNFPLTTPKE